MILVIVPPELTIQNVCPTLQGSATIIPNPQCTITGNNITITNINSTTNNIVPQTITITIKGVTNYYAETLLTSFYAYIYYTSDDIDLVAIATGEDVRMVAR